MKTWVMILGLAVMNVGAHGLPVRAEGQLPLHVLYVGKTKTPRAEQFIGFFKKHFANVTLADRAANTPLMHAAAGGDYPTVERLLAANPGVKVRNLQGWSALDFAQAAGASEAKGIKP